MVDIPVRGRPEGEQGRSRARCRRRAGARPRPPAATHPSDPGSLGVGSRLPRPAPDASGQCRLGRAARERIPETSRAAPPRAAPTRAPGCPASRLPPRASRPPARAPKPGRYSHGDAFAPGCAAGKLSDPHGHRQRGAGSSQT